MKALVTGGGGFLGSEVVRMLLERGDEVRSLARGEHPWLAAAGVDVHRGDVADPDAVDRAVAGVDVVLHVAARAGQWGPEAEYRATNVDGTRNVVLSCRRHGVGRLVHTSSPSVVHGGEDLRGVDESVPYPAHHDSAYSRTKAAAERLVLATNDDELATTALRPHLVWGPGDNQLLPRIAERARSRRGLLLPGGGTAVVDTTYVTDAARAHLLAADVLAPGAACAGRAYFISAGDPRPVREVLDLVLPAYGAPPVRGSVPVPVALGAATTGEAVWRLLRRPGEPPLTRFVVRQLSTAHWFDLTAARRDLGYEPQVDVAEGARRLAAVLSAG